MLRLIAGFELPTAAPIELDGGDVQRPAFDRDVNTVFQDYALFPHMTSRERRVRAAVQKVPSGARDARGEALASVRLEALAERSPPAVRRPAPAGRAGRARWSTARRCCCSTSRSGALDLKLREQMQVELKELQREVGITSSSSRTIRARRCR
jgi:putative spermidine/putrescine transport system ATP-binding protein